MSTKRRNILLLVLASALVLLGTVWTPLSGDGRWTDILLTSGHGAAFALTAVLLALVFSQSSPARRWPVWLHYGTVFALTGLFGFGTEILQIWLPRDANLEDLRTDLLGAWLGLGVFAMFDSRLRTLGRIGLPFSSLFPFLVLAIPLVTAIQAYAHREATFPVLADYRESFDEYFLQAQGTWRVHDLMPEAWAAYTGEQVMHIAFVASAWPGLHFAEPSPDWSGFETLALDVTNPNTADFPLSIRVHDRAHDGQYRDRFNAVVELAPGERSVVRLPVADIENGPRDRKMDIDEVAGLILFVSADTEPERIGKGLFVSRIWLE